MAGGGISYDFGNYSPEQIKQYFEGKAILESFRVKYPNAEAELSEAEKREIFFARINDDIDRDAVIKVIDYYENNKKYIVDCSS